MTTGNNTQDQKIHFDSASVEYDRALFTPAAGAINRRFRTICRLLDSAIPLGDNILEIGAGTGIFTREIDNMQLRFFTSGDISLNMMRKAQKRCTDRVKFVQFGAEHLPFPDNTFDTIFSFACIHHIRDIDSMFKECHRVLKKNGSLLAMEPNPLFPLNALIGLTCNHERGMLTSWPEKLISAASHQNLFCKKMYYGAFFPGKPLTLEPVYRIVEPVLEKIPVIRNFSIFVFYQFTKRE